MAGWQEGIAGWQEGIAGWEGGKVQGQ